MIFAVLAFLSAVMAWLLFRNKIRVEHEVKDGVLQIELGEDISGPSYQIAAGEVGSVVFGIVAIAFTVIAMIHIVAR